MLKTEAIRNFLRIHTHGDLATLYDANMEVQVNVRQDNGEQVDGEYKGKRWLGYTDGVTTWKPFRIPFNANTDPTYTDSNIGFDLTLHCDGIGMTGWDWKNKVSKWVAFDFDALIGHSDKHTKKLTAEQLQEIQDVVKSVDWVTLRKSTSGRGLHLYVLLNDVPTSNHTEHAALARAILSNLSGLTGFNFAEKVDICGGNMWVWHSKMKGTDGLSLLKLGSVLNDVPPNWRDHIGVVTRKTRRVRPKEVSTKESDFNDLIDSRSRIVLDEQHKELMNYLEKHGYRWWWDAENHMLVTHTYTLKQAHETLKYQGPFETIATGKDGGEDHNCYCFPLRQGGWVVRRYGQHTKEADTWMSDLKGWTKCYLNKVPDLATVARLYKATETEKHGFIFNNLEDVQKAFKYFNLEFKVPVWASNRKTTVKELVGKNKLVVSFGETEQDSPNELEGWHTEKKQWRRVFNCMTLLKSTETAESENFDERIRHVVTLKGQDAGWLLYVGGMWREEPLANIRLALTDLEMGTKDLNMVLGDAVNNGWVLVNKPFQPEYPGNREWNRSAAQLRCVPTVDTDNLSYPTWQLILQHCGNSLTPYILENEWCQRNGVKTGEQYLALWLAILFQHPTKPLPYLFFWGVQNAGKSFFHEAVCEYLVLNGHMRANAALVSASNFNAEIENKILCIIEEVDLRKNNNEAYNKIKEWVTSPEMLIHIKGMTPYMAPNCTHWIQTGNDRGYCPVFAGDTRITMIQVPMPEKLIPKDTLRKQLEKEAPDFLSYLLSVEIPDSEDRLALPTIETDDKKQAEENNMNEIDKFIHDGGYYKKGHSVLASEFIEKFLASLNADQVGYWSKQRIGRTMDPTKHPRGRVGSAIDINYGNISFDPDAVDKDYYLIAHKSFLKQVKYR